MTAWKSFERRVAKALGGTRSGPVGRMGSDIVGTPFAVECKRTTRYCLRSSWIAQARRSSKMEGKPWMLAISQHNDPRPLIVMELSTFVEVAGMNRCSLCGAARPCLEHETLEER